MIKGPNIELGSSWMQGDGPHEPGIFIAIWDYYVYVHIGSPSIQTLS